MSKGLQLEAERSNRFISSAIRGQHIAKTWQLQQYSKIHRGTQEIANMKSDLVHHQHFPFCHCPPPHVNHLQFLHHYSWQQSREAH